MRLLSRNAASTNKKCSNSSWMRYCTSRTICLGVDHSWHSSSFENYLRAHLWRKNERMKVRVSCPVLTLDRWRDTTRFLWQRAFPREGIPPLAQWDVPRSTRGALCGTQRLIMRHIVWHIPHEGRCRGTEGAVYPFDHPLFPDRIPLTGPIIWYSVILNKLKVDISVQVSLIFNVWI